MGTQIPPVAGLDAFMSKYPKLKAHFGAVHRSCFYSHVLGCVKAKVERLDSSRTLLSPLRSGIGRSNQKVEPSGSPFARLSPPRSLKSSSARVPGILQGNRAIAQCQREVIIAAVCSFLPRRGDSLQLSGVLARL